MTHSILVHAGEIKNQNKLITEGICVNFDLSHNDQIERIQAARQPYVIKDIWQNKIKADDNLIYPLGGELVKRLIITGGRENFMKLLVDQSYENAKLIYGDELDGLIKQLEIEGQ
jgi:hypothetical protein